MAFLDDYDLGEDESPMDIDTPEKKKSSFLDDYDIPDDGMPSPKQVTKPAQVKPEQGDIAAGWDAGWEGYKSLGNLAKGAFGQMIGNDEMQAEGLADAKKNEAAAAEYGKGHKTRIEDVENVGDFIDYAQYGLATLIPYALESMGASIIGGVVGGAAAGPGGAAGGAAAGFIGRSAVKSMVREYAKGSLKGVSKKKIEGMVKQDMLDYAGGRMKDKATKKLIESSYKRAAANAGAKAGAFASGARMGFGDVYGNTVEAGDPSPYLSAVLAVPYGILDMMPEAMGIDRIMAKSTDGILKRIGKGMVAQMPAEGLTELAQEEINIRTQAGLNPEYDPYSDEANSIRLNSLILGALGGGVFGAMSGGLQKTAEEGAGGLSPIELQYALNHPDSPMKERMRALYKVEAAMAVDDPEAAAQWRTFAEGRIKEGKPILLEPDEMKVATEEILRQQEATEQLDKETIKKRDEAGRKSAFEDVGEFVQDDTKNDVDVEADKEKEDLNDVDAASAKFEAERGEAKKKEREAKSGVVINQKLKNKEEAEKKAADAKIAAGEGKAGRRAELNDKRVPELRKELQARNPDKKLPMMRKPDLIKALMEPVEEIVPETPKAPTREEYSTELLGMKKKRLREIAADVLPKHYKSKKKSLEELANDIADIEFPAGKKNEHIWDPRIINDPEIMGAVRSVVDELSEANKPQYIKTFEALTGGDKGGEKQHTGYKKSPSMNKLISELHIDDAEVFMKEQKDAITALDTFLEGGRTPGPRAQKIITALLDVQQEGRYEGQVVENTGRQPRAPFGVEGTPATEAEQQANAVPAEFETDEGLASVNKQTPIDVDFNKLRTIKQLRTAAEAANPDATMDLLEKEMSASTEAKALRKIIKDESEKRAAERAKPKKEADAIDTGGYVSAEIRTAVRTGKTVGRKDAKGDIVDEGLDIEGAIFHIDNLIELEKRGKLTKDRLMKDLAMRMTSMQSVAEVKEIFDKGNIGELLEEIRSDLMKRDLNGKLIEGMDEVLNPTKEETNEEVETKGETENEEKGEEGGKEAAGETEVEREKRLEKERKEVKKRTKKEAKGREKWMASDREDRVADLDYVGISYVDTFEWADKKWPELSDDIRNRLSNKALGRNLEHLRNDGEVLDETYVFEDNDWGPLESSEPIDESVLVEGMDKEAWSLGINEDAERFADPQEQMVNIEAQEKKKIKGGASFATKEEAKKTIDGWIADAKADRKNGNTNRYILSMFDHTGNWSKPWLDAGYNVLTFDIQNGQDVLDFSFDYFVENWDVGDVYGILAACPCTDFTTTSAKHWKGKDAGGDTELSKRLVFQTLETINHFKPKFWTIENPPGRIERMTGLPKARAQFQPHNFGEDYTKRTKLWGSFNAEMPTVNTEPTEGNDRIMKLGGKSLKTKNARSITPEGFAYAFYKANNFNDKTAEQRLREDYPWIYGATREALKAGMTEEEIREIADSPPYYEYNDQGQATKIRNLLAKEVARRLTEKKPTTKKDWRSQMEEDDAAFTAAIDAAPDSQDMIDLREKNRQRTADLFADVIPKDREEYAQQWANSRYKRGKKGIAVAQSPDEDGVFNVTVDGFGSEMKRNDDGTWSGGDHWDKIIMPNKELEAAYKKYLDSQKKEEAVEKPETGSSEADMFGEMSDADFDALMEDTAPTPPPTEENTVPTPAQEERARDGVMRDVRSLGETGLSKKKLPALKQMAKDAGIKSSLTKPKLVQSLLDWADGRAINNLPKPVNGVSFNISEYSHADSGLRNVIAWDLSDTVENQKDINSQVEHIAFFFGSSKIKKMPTYDGEKSEKGVHFERWDDLVRFLEYYTGKTPKRSDNVNQDFMYVQYENEQKIDEKPVEDPLADINVDEEVTIEETGEEVTVSESADVLLKNANDRIGGLKSLIDCLS